MVFTDDVGFSWQQYNLFLVTDMRYMSCPILLFPAITSVSHILYVSWVNIVVIPSVSHTFTLLGEHKDSFLFPNWWFMSMWLYISPAHILMSVTWDQSYFSGFCMSESGLVYRLFSCRRLFGDIFCMINFQLFGDLHFTFIQKSYCDSDRVLRFFAIGGIWEV